MTPGWPGGGAEGTPRWPGDRAERTVAGELFDRRIVMAAGVLDDALAGEVVAQLMTLDATGDGEIGLYLNSAGGTLDAAFAVMDTVDLLGVDVRATCLGRLEGPPVGVLAVAKVRHVAPNARLRLSEPDSTLAGRPAQLGEWARSVARGLDDFCERVGRACGRPPDVVAADVRSGRWLSAEEAVVYGLADKVARPDARVYPFVGGRPPFGFRP